MYIIVLFTSKINYEREHYYIIYKFRVYDKPWSSDCCFWCIWCICNVCSRTWNLPGQRCISPRIWVSEPQYFVSTSRSPAWPCICSWSSSCVRLVFVFYVRRLLVLRNENVSKLLYVQQPIADGMVSHVQHKG